jgi:excisionase family DNA binding protein
MTVEEVAAFLNVDKKTVYRMAQRGDLPGFKVAGTWRFRREDLDRWIETQLQRSQVGPGPTDGGAGSRPPRKPAKRGR